MDVEAVVADAHRKALRALCGASRDERLARKATHVWVQQPKGAPVGWVGEVRCVARELRAIFAALARDVKTCLDESVPLELDIMKGKLARQKEYFRSSLKGTLSHMTSFLTAHGPASSWDPYDDPLPTTQLDFLALFDGDEDAANNMYKMRDYLERQHQHELASMKCKYQDAAARKNEELSQLRQRVDFLHTIIGDPSGKSIQTPPQRERRRSLVPSAARSSDPQKTPSTRIVELMERAPGGEPATPKHEERPETQDQAAQTDEPEEGEDPFLTWTPRSQMREVHSLRHQVQELRDNLRQTDILASSIARKRSGFYSEHSPTSTASVTPRRLTITAAAASGAEGKEKQVAVQTITWPSASRVCDVEAGGNGIAQLVAQMTTPASAYTCDTGTGADGMTSVNFDTLDLAASHRNGGPGDFAGSPRPVSSRSGDVDAASHASKQAAGMASFAKKFGATSSQGSSARTNASSEKDGKERAARAEKKPAKGKEKRRRSVKFDTGKDREGGGGGRPAKIPTAARDVAGDGADTGTGPAENREGPETLAVHPESSVDGLASAGLDTSGTPLADDARPLEADSQRILLEQPVPADDGGGLSDREGQSDIGDARTRKGRRGSRNRGARVAKALRSTQGATHAICTVVDVDSRALAPDFPMTHQRDGWSFRSSPAPHSCGRSARGTPQHGSTAAPAMEIRARKVDGSVDHDLSSGVADVFDIDVEVPDIDSDDMCAAAHGRGADDHGSSQRTWKSPAEAPRVKSMRMNMTPDYTTYRLPGQRLDIRPDKLAPDAADAVKSLIPKTAKDESLFSATNHVEDMISAAMSLIKNRYDATVTHASARDSKRVAMAASSVGADQARQPYAHACGNFTVDPRETAKADAPYTKKLTAASVKLLSKKMRLDLAGVEASRGDSEVFCLTGSRHHHPP